MQDDYREVQRIKTASQIQWNDWKWQLSNRFLTVKNVFDEVEVPSEIRIDAENAESHELPFGFGLTPYFVGLLKQLLVDDPNSARSLLRTVLPTGNEADPLFAEWVDGMGEDATGSHALISRLYTNRALLFVSKVCPVYCRYCFRRRKVSDKAIDTPFLNSKEIQQAIDKIASDPRIDDVIVSGGDPLMLPDNRIFDLLERLRLVKSIRLIRFDTKTVTTLPQRITEQFVRELKNFHPVYFTLHFVHPAEITKEVANACRLLAEAGVPLGAYIPLLRGINDDRSTLIKLFTELAYIRVRPYYLVDNVANRWTDQFTVPLEEAFELVDGLQGDVSGPALPTLVVYLPNAGGKVPLAPQGYNAIEKTDSGWKIRGHDGNYYDYSDVAPN